MTVRWSLSDRPHQGITTKQRWDADDIRARSKTMIDRIIKFWPGH